MSPLATNSNPAASRPPCTKASPSGGGAERSEAKGGRRLYPNILPACVQSSHTMFRLPAHSIFMRCCPLQSRFARHSPRGGAFFWFQHRLFFSGFRLCPTRATARVAPTAVFRDVCRGDPCGRPILPLSDLVQNGPGDPAPTGEVISKSE